MSKINKRVWEQRKRISETPYRSFKSNNHVVCLDANRTKYLYESEARAKVALKFNSEIGAVRYYACPTCYGYHLTSKPLRASGNKYALKPAYKPS